MEKIFRLIVLASVGFVLVFLTVACGPAGPSVQRYGEIPPEAIESSGVRYKSPIFVKSLTTGKIGTLLDEVGNPPESEGIIVWASRGSEDAVLERVPATEWKYLKPQEIPEGIVTKSVEQPYQIAKGASLTDQILTIGFFAGMIVVGNRLIAPPSKAIEGVGVTAKVARLSEGEIATLLQRARKLTPQQWEAEIAALKQAGRITTEDARLLQTTQNPSEMRAVLAGSSRAQQLLDELRTTQGKVPIALSYRGTTTAGFSPGAGSPWVQLPLIPYSIAEEAWSARLFGLRFGRGSSFVAVSDPTADLLLQYLMTQERRLKELEQAVAALRNQPSVVILNNVTAHGGQGGSAGASAIAKGGRSARSNLSFRDWSVPDTAPTATRINLPSLGVSASLNRLGASAVSHTPVRSLALPAPPPVPALPPPSLPAK